VQVGTGVRVEANCGLGLTFDCIPQKVDLQVIYKPNPENRAMYDQVFGKFARFYVFGRK